MNLVKRKPGVKTARQSVEKKTDLVDNFFLKPESSILEPFSKRFNVIQLDVSSPKISLLANNFETSKLPKLAGIKSESNLKTNR